MDDLLAMMRRPEFRSVRAEVKRHFDMATYAEVLRRFPSNRRLQAVLPRVVEAASVPHETRTRIWLRRPRWVRAETSGDGGRTWSVSGGDGESSWQWLPDGETYVWIDRSTAVILWRDDDEPDEHETLTGGSAYDALDNLSIAHTHLHPEVAELLDPRELLEEGLALTAFTSDRFLGREVVRSRGWLPGWNEDRDFGLESLTPADDYELVIDTDTGVVLRFSARAREGEFAVTEFTTVAFDEELPQELFVPP